MSRPELLPHLQLDELLAELQSRLQAVLATRDRMRGLLEAVVGIGHDGRPAMVNPRYELVR